MLSGGLGRTARRSRPGTGHCHWVKLNAARHSCKQTYPDSLDQKLITTVNTELTKTRGGLSIEKSSVRCQVSGKRLAAGATANRGD